MHISSVQIDNYKSFRHLDEIHFTPGINVIVGQNNVGKTALVEALALRSGDRPHRSLRTIPVAGAQPDPYSAVGISFHVTKEELLEMLRTLQIFNVPVSSEKEPILSTRARFLAAISEWNTIRAVWRNEQFFRVDLGDFEFSVQAANQPCVRFKMVRAATEPEPDSGPLAVDYRDLFGFQLAYTLRNSIYLFNAERLNLSKAAIGVNPNLAPNAANLAEVLHQLQTRNETRFERLNENIRQIFPDIRRVIAPMESSQSFYILVRTAASHPEREDLAIQLSESGTGIGQVLAMLYVVITSDSPRTIIIDEPQSFLHPGAVRKLFDILKEQPIQHQYIITTHSPTAVTAADAQTIVLVRKPEAESVVETLDMAETNSLRLFLSEVGARLSDVFGADGILWVEGQTEELCFPLILSKIASRRLYGTAIIGVLQTGDFVKRKQAEATFDIYTRLSQGRGLLPPAVGFIFDQEGRTKQEQLDIARKSKGAVQFLPRRMYECYLLNPEAIAAVMSSIQGFRDRPVTAEEVRTWLRQHQWEKKYLAQTIPEEERSPDVWLRHVHGAEILQDVFSEFSQARVNYDKVQCGVTLTNWILENCPDELKEIAEFIVRILNSHSEDGC